MWKKRMNWAAIITVLVYLAVTMAERVFFPIQLGEPIHLIRWFITVFGIFAGLCWLWLTVQFVELLFIQRKPWWQ